MAWFSDYIVIKNYGDCRLFQVHSVSMLTVSIHLFTGGTLSVNRSDKGRFWHQLDETIDAAEVSDQGL